MGHANISITLALYGHLMPGNESEAAELLDTYLEAQRQKADEVARGGLSRPVSRSEADSTDRAELLA